MNPPQLKLVVLPERLAVCRLGAANPVPESRARLTPCPIALMFAAERPREGVGGRRMGVDLDQAAGEILNAVRGG